MRQQYTANAYCNEEKIAAREGDNIDLLYAWIILQANGKFGDVHGEVIDNTTNKVVRTFQKAYED